MNEYKKYNFKIIVQRKQQNKMNTTTTRNSMVKEKQIQLEKELQGKFIQNIKD